MGLTDRPRGQTLWSEEKENDQDRKSRKHAYMIALAFLLGGGVVCLVPPEIGSFGVIISLYIALFTFVKGDKKKKRRYVNSDEIVIDEEMLYYREKNYNNVAQLFKSAGFIYVNAIPMDDLNFITRGKNGQVETVTIDGKEDYEEGDIFRKNAPVLITYHIR